MAAAVARQGTAGVPYGIALAIGALLIYPETEWMKAIDLSRFRSGLNPKRTPLTRFRYASLTML